MGVLSIAWAKTKKVDEKRKTAKIKQKYGEWSLKLSSRLFCKLFSFRLSFRELKSSTNIVAFLERTEGGQLG